MKVEIFLQNGRMPANSIHPQVPNHVEHLPYIEGNLLVIDATKRHVDRWQHVLNGERPRADAPSSIRQDGSHVDPPLRTIVGGIPRILLTR